MTISRDHHAPAVTDPRIAVVANEIRRRVLEQTLRADGGYLSQACSSAEILATLYTAILRLGPVSGSKQPDDFRGVPGRPDANPTGRRHHGEPGAGLDRFIVSPSHYAMAVYAALIAVGRLESSALEAFNADGSTMEMIGAEHSPGFELTTGSMGQALSQAIGIAVARRWRGETGDTWVFMGDGELQEGQVWEAVQFAGVQGLDRLRVVVDVNGQQVDGRTDDVLDNGSLVAKFASFGADAVTIDGHDPARFLEVANAAREGRPLVVLAETDPARGLPALRERAPKLHFVRVGADDELAHFHDELVRLQAVVA